MNSAKKRQKLEETKSRLMKFGISEQYFIEAQVNKLKYLFIFQQKKSYYCLYTFDYQNALLFYKKINQLDEIKKVILFFILNFHLLFSTL